MPLGACWTWLTASTLVASNLGAAESLRADDPQSAHSPPFRSLLLPGPGADSLLLGFGELDGHDIFLYAPEADPDGNPIVRTIEVREHNGAPVFWLDVDDSGRPARLRSAAGEAWSWLEAPGEAPRWVHDDPAARTQPLRRRADGADPDPPSSQFLSPVTLSTEFPFIPQPCPATSFAMQWAPDPVIGGTHIPVRCTGSIRFTNANRGEDCAIHVRIQALTPDGHVLNETSADPLTGNWRLEWVMPRSNAAWWADQACADLTAAAIAAATKPGISAAATQLTTLNLPGAAITAAGSLIAWAGGVTLGYALCDNPAITTRIVESPNLDPQAANVHIAFIAAEPCAASAESAPRILPLALPTASRGGEALEVLIHACLDLPRRPESPPGELSFSMRDDLRPFDALPVARFNTRLAPNGDRKFFSPFGTQGPPRVEIVRDKIIERLGDQVVIEEKRTTMEAGGDVRVRHAPDSLELLADAFLGVTRTITERIENNQYHPVSTEQPSPLAPVVSITGEAEYRLLLRPGDSLDLRFLITPVLISGAAEATVRADITIKPGYTIFNEEDLTLRASCDLILTARQIPSPRGDNESVWTRFLSARRTLPSLDGLNVNPIRSTVESAEYQGGLGEFGTFTINLDSTDLRRYWRLDVPANIPPAIDLAADPLVAALLQQSRWGGNDPNPAQQALLASMATSALPPKARRALAVDGPAILAAWNCGCIPVRICIKLDITTQAARGYPADQLPAGSSRARFEITGSFH